LLLVGALRVHAERDGGGDREVVLGSRRLGPPGWRRWGRLGRALVLRLRRFDLVGFDETHQVQGVGSRRSAVLLRNGSRRLRRLERRHQRVQVEDQVGVGTRRRRRRRAVPPELLSEEGERRQLLSALRLPYRFRQGQLHRKLVATVGVVSDQFRYAAEAVLARLEPQMSFGGLDEVVLDVGSLVDGESHGEGHGVALRRLSYHETTFFFALEQVERPGSLDSGQEPDGVRPDQAFGETDVAGGSVTLKNAMKTPSGTVSRLAVPDSPLSSLPPSEPPLDERRDSPDADRDGGAGDELRAFRHGGGDGDGAPTIGL
jgi:hypothetical protein